MGDILGTQCPPLSRNKPPILHTQVLQQQPETFSVGNLVFCPLAQGSIINLPKPLGNLNSSSNRNSTV
jgi:hypothetical protein